MKSIYFDMDGTLADLYSIDCWVDRLHNNDDSVYIEAAPMINFKKLAQLLNKLQNNGYKIGIISWNSKCGDENFFKAVIKAKRKWLNKHLPSIIWDEIHIIKYGSPKHFNCQDNSGILFDDNEDIRKLWNKRGKAFNEKDILEVLTSLI